MPVVRPPQGLDVTDYEDIEAAVMETARGRWFLDEHARRTRAAETARMSEALGALAEIVRSQPAQLPSALDQRFAQVAGVVEERLLDISWFLRARGVDESICELLNREAGRLRNCVQGEVDDAETAIAPAAIMLSASVEALPPSAIEAMTLTEPPPVRPDALASLDALPLREKLKLFA